MWLMDSDEWFYKNSGLLHRNGMLYGCESTPPAIVILEILGITYMSGGTMLICHGIIMFNYTRVLVQLI